MNGQDTAGPAPTATSAAPASWVAVHLDRGHYRTEVAARGHTLVLDEPTDVGGTDAGATPYEALLAALGGCTAMTVRMYADRKGWPLEAVHVRLRTARTHGADCATCETDPVGPHRLEREVRLDGALTDEQRRRLLQIADRCPLKQTLERGVRVVEAAAV